MAENQIDTGSGKGFFRSLLIPSSRYQGSERHSLNAPLSLSIDNLDELVAWLSLDVSSSDAACKATWSGLYDFVKASADEFVALCVGGVNGRDAVADLLTEVLRVCNFAQHDKHIINEFLTIMTRCAITVVGDPEICKTYATFKNLGYSKTTHQVTMSSK